MWGAEQPVLGQREQSWEQSSTTRPPLPRGFTCPWVSVGISPAPLRAADIFWERTRWRGCCKHPSCTPGHWAGVTGGNGCRRTWGHQFPGNAWQELGAFAGRQEGSPACCAFQLVPRKDTTAPHGRWFCVANRVGSAGRGQRGSFCCSVPCTNQAGLGGS